MPGSQVGDSSLQLDCPGNIELNNDFDDLVSSLDLTNTDPLLEQCGKPKPKACKPKPKPCKKSEPAGLSCGSTPVRRKKEISSGCTPAKPIRVKNYCRKKSKKKRSCHKKRPKKRKSCGKKKRSRPKKRSCGKKKRSRPKKRSCGKKKRSRPKKRSCGSKKRHKKRKSKSCGSKKRSRPRHRKSKGSCGGGKKRRSKGGGGGSCAVRVKPHCRSKPKRSRGRRGGGCSAQMIPSDPSNTQMSLTSSNVASGPYYSYSQRAREPDFGDYVRDCWKVSKRANRPAFQDTGNTVPEVTRSAARCWKTMIPQQKNFYRVRNSQATKASTNENELPRYHY